MEDAVIITNRFVTETGGSTHSVWKHTFGLAEYRSYEVQVACFSNTNKAFSATYRFLIKTADFSTTTAQVGAIVESNKISDTDLNATTVNLVLATNSVEMLVAGVDAESPLSWCVTTKYYQVFQSQSTTFNPTV